MILIDAHNIVNGGGMTLLNYLIFTLEERNLDYFLIKNTAIKVFGQTNKQINCKGPQERRKIIREAVQNTKSKNIFCFGNYPPQDRFPAYTITYIQNPYLVNRWYELLHKDKLLPLRQLYLRVAMKNSDCFVFQNNLIKEKFIKLYGDKNKSYQVVPFYDDRRIKSIKNSDIQKKHQFIYVSLPHPHKNHNYLLSVWKELNQKNYNPRLLLTIPESRKNKELLEAIEKINSKGGQIQNLGVVPFDDVLRHTAESKFCIYPSTLETLGLGLIEAALLGVKILASDLPYTREVVKPSLYFDPYNNTSGTDAVLFALENESNLENTLPLLNNRIEELLDLLTRHDVLKY